MTARRQPSHGAQHRLQRSLRAITIGAPQRQRKLEAELAPLRGGDTAQGVHVPVKGKAGAVLSNTELTVGLPLKFLTRILVAEDDVEPTVPTFTYGYELLSDADVILTACVRDWIEDERGLIASARVRVSSLAPGASEQLPFNAVMHLQFTGIAAPDEGDDDDTSTVPSAPTTTPEPPLGGGPSGDNG